MRGKFLLCLLFCTLSLGAVHTRAQGGARLGFVALTSGPDGTLETGLRSLVMAAPSDGIEVIFEDWKLGAEAAWSPDGRTLAYVMLDAPYAGGYSPDFDLFEAPPEPLPRATLHLMHMESGETSPPLTDSGMVGNLQWSPRGSAILFTMREDTDGDGRLTYDDRALPYLLDVGSYSVGPVDVPPGATGGFYRWAPDGSGFYIATALNSDEWWFGVFAPDGSLLDVVAERERLDATNIAWSPDGRSLAYVDLTGAGEQEGLCRAMLYDLDVGESRQISDPMAVVQLLSWSPLGNVLAFAAISESGQPVLFAFNLAANSMTVFTDSDLLYYSRLAFSPDGRWIAFLGDPGEGMEQVFLLEVGTGNIIRLTEGGNAELSGLEWSPPDGRYLAFTYAIEDTDGDGQITGFDFRSLMIVSAPDWAVTPIGRQGERAARAEGFAWSPDGRWIAYVAKVDTDGDGSITSADWDQLFVVNPSEDFPAQSSGRLLTGGMSVVPHTVRWVR